MRSPAVAGSFYPSDPSELRASVARCFRSGPGEPGEWIIAPPGRPRLSDEELVTVAFKIPESQRDLADRIAQERNQTRSEFMRAAVAAAIASA